MMTLIIIAVTSIISIIAFSKHDLMLRFQFNPYQVKHDKQWYRFLSHGFLHANWLHLIANMFVLFFFGRMVEAWFMYYFGLKGFLYYGLLYLGGVIFASLTTYKKYQNAHWYNSVGASGAVSAVVFAAVLLEPMSEICLYGILCLPGIIWGVIYLIYSWYMSKKEADHINHDAHFTGAIFGFLFTIAIKPALAKLFVEQIANFFS